MCQSNRSFTVIYSIFFFGEERDVPVIDGCVIYFLTRKYTPRHNYKSGLQFRKGKYSVRVIELSDNFIYSIT